LAVDHLRVAPLLVVRELVVRELEQLVAVAQEAVRHRLLDRRVVRLLAAPLQVAVLEEGLVGLCPRG